MVHPGEPQVFEGQGPEAFYGRGHRQAPARTSSSNCCRTLLSMDHSLTETGAKVKCKGRQAGTRASCEPPALTAFRMV